MNRNNRINSGAKGVQARSRIEDHLWGMVSQVNNACSAWLLARGLKSDEELMRDNYKAGILRRGIGRPKKAESEEDELT